VKIASPAETFEAFFRCLRAKLTEYLLSSSRPISRQLLVPRGGQAASCLPDWQLRSSDFVCFSFSLKAKCSLRHRAPPKSAQSKASNNTGHKESFSDSGLRTEYNAQRPAPCSLSAFHHHHHRLSMLHSPP